MLYVIEKEKNGYEERLSVALKENQMLFKEVHHRTKNNMQVIMGLLETQSFKIDNPKYKKMFETHVDRLKAMSLMHKNLYTNHSYEEVNIKEYLEEIKKNLQTYTEHKIIIDVDTVKVNMKIAMSIGLIFNEAVTNAIEHAFINEVGTIEVLFKQAEGHCVFSITDTGKGFDTTKTYQSLGLTLIEDLSSTLLNSSVSILGEKGVTIKIDFDLEEYTL
jgi:two-component sensor histidine kinase